MAPCAMLVVRVSIAGVALPVMCVWGLQVNVQLVSPGNVRQVNVARLPMAVEIRWIAVLVTWMAKSAMSLPIAVVPVLPLPVILQKRLAVPFPMVVVMCSIAVVALRAFNVSATSALFRCHLSSV